MDATLRGEEFNLQEEVLNVPRAVCGADDGNAFRRTS